MTAYLRDSQNIKSILQSRTDQTNIIRACVTYGTLAKFPLSKVLEFLAARTSNDSECLRPWALLNL